jgi:hypothetical protein
MSATDLHAVLLEGLRLYEVTSLRTDLTQHAHRDYLAEHLAEVLVEAGWSERAEEKSSREADATPGPTGRVAQLLDAIRTHRGRWTVTRTTHLYRALPSTAAIPTSKRRVIARGDLRDLHAWGHLDQHDPDDAPRYYTLKTRKDGRS